MSTVKERAEKDEALARLRETVRPGDTLRTILRHVSASGMTRHIDVVKVEDGDVRYLTAQVALACGYRRAKDGSLVVGGCGMDMGFSVVYTLSDRLYGHGTEGYACLGERCPSNYHVNSRDHSTQTEPHTDGYAVSQRWL